VLADEWLGAAAKEAAENEGDDDCVVELACDWNEVGNELRPKCEVASKRDWKSLLPPWEARVAKQAATEDDAIGDEPGERAGALATPGDDEHRDEQCVRDGERGESDEKPVPQRHPARFTVPLRAPVSCAA
jgi:hypothetical protein